MLANVEDSVTVHFFHMNNELTFLKYLITANQEWQLYKKMLHFALGVYVDE